jgi:hypothetical protein
MNVPTLTPVLHRKEQHVSGSAEETALEFMELAACSSAP